MRARDEKIAGSIIQDICELPDRTSPGDQPELLQVTLDELRLILLRNLAELRAGAEPVAWCLIVPGEGILCLNEEKRIPENYRYRRSTDVLTPLYTHPPVTREAELAAEAEHGGDNEA